MKITVEISDSELREIRQFTGERKKGPAIRKLVADALQMKRRARFVQEVLSGKWGVELKGYEEAQLADRQRDERVAQAMND
jgi:hypothetical protein